MSCFNFLNVVFYYRVFYKNDFNIQLEITRDFVFIFWLKSGTNISELFSLFKFENTKYSKSMYLGSFEGNGEDSWSSKCY